MIDQSKSSDKKIAISPIYLGVPVIYSITRVLEYFTGTSEFWPKVWLSIVNFFGNDNFNMHVVATILYSNFFIYWSIGLIFIFFDLTLKPEFIRKYKTQEATNEPVDRQKLMKTVKAVLFNQVFISVPLTYLGYCINKSKGFPTSLFDIPSFTTVLIHLVVCVLCDEIGFYYSHRLLHQGIFYKMIHKQHHEWSAPISIAAIYAHPLEHLFGNLLPVASGPLLMKSHLGVIWIWFTIATLITIFNHSGYHLPFCLSTEFHDFHHARSVECFGKVGLLDRLHRTDKLFRSTINFSRHRLLLSLKSARERYPDVKEIKSAKSD